jgi:hypothetical protein
VKRALLVLLLLTIAACGGSVADRHVGEETQAGVNGLGIAVDLPPSWNARILLGAEGRAVLHAANFPLPSNDGDTGEVAQQTIGSSGQMYVNVRDLGPGESDAALPVAFQRSDFGPPPPGPGSRCCFITVADRDVAAWGHVYHVAVISGSDEPPSDAALAEANALLSTLSLQPYEAQAPTPARGDKHLTGYGIDLTLPPDWDGRVASGKVEAASFELAETAIASGPFAGSADDIAIRLLESGGSDAPFVTVLLPLLLVPTEFVPPDAGERGPALTGRSFVVSGREFALSVVAGSLPPSAAALVEVNALLASLRVEPGDFYPGQVDPATFASAPGWYTGTSGPADIEPEGEQTTSWAATVPYRDPPDQFPPHETLAALPPDGIAIVVWLSRSPGSGGELPVEEPPFQLADAERGSFAGVPADRATYRIGASMRGGADVTIWIFFGRPDPSDKQLDRAQAELDSLRLPDWPNRG